ncbi:DUF6807 domain-containing protein [Kineococcus sp. SYSU DK002]|uniref:DUF6807 domain-containing protein n=1 Tax=Kineococcus sp. SYSU DK002 TaxID=3383123 RepID=UPI003D7D57FC
MSALHGRHEPGTGEYRVGDGAVELTRYHYVSDVAQLESPRPYLHPLRTRAGHLVSLYRPWDHVWHKGITWSLPHLGPDNFWGGPTFVRGEGYRQLENDGSMDTVEVTSATEGTAEELRFTHRLRWTTQRGEQVVAEERTLGFRLVDDATWALTFSTAMKNVSGAGIAIGSPTTAGRDNAGYGGLFWRGPRSFTDGTVLAPQGDGGDELRGQRAAWMGFTGRHDEVDAASSLVFVDAADNPRHPPQWFVRSEQFAAVCPAPFFSEELPFAAGSTLRFRYAVVIADGSAEGSRGRELAQVGRDVLAAGLS